MFCQFVIFPLAPSNTVFQFCLLFLLSSIPSALCVMIYSPGLILDFYPSTYKSLRITSANTRIEFFTQKFENCVFLFFRNYFVSSFFFIPIHQWQQTPPKQTRSTKLIPLSPILNPPISTTQHAPNRHTTILTVPPFLPHVVHGTPNVLIVNYNSLVVMV